MTLFINNSQIVKVNYDLKTDLLLFLVQRISSGHWLLFLRQLLFSHGDLLISSGASAGQPLTHSHTTTSHSSTYIYTCVCITTGLTILARDIGGRLVLLMYSRLRTTLLKGASVRRAKNLYSWQRCVEGRVRIN